MKFTNVSKSLPTETGVYTVKYKAAKSNVERVGTAKYTKSKKSFSSITTESGRELQPAPPFRADNDTWDTRPSSNPRVVAWR